MGFLERGRQLLDWQIGLMDQRLNRLKGIRNNIAGATGEFEGPAGTPDGDYLSVEGEVGDAGSTGTADTSGSGASSGSTTSSSDISARMWDEIFKETRKRTEEGYPRNRDVQDQLEDRGLDSVPESVWHSEFDAYLHRKEAREHAHHDDHDDHDHDDEDHDGHETRPDHDDYNPLFVRIANDHDSVYFTKYPTLSLPHVKKWLARNSYKYDKDSVLNAWKDFQEDHPAERRPDDDDYKPLFKRIFNDHDSVYFTKFPSLSLTHVKKWLERNHYTYDRKKVLEAWKDFQEHEKKALH